MNFNPFSSKEVSALVNFRSERLQMVELLCTSRLSLVVVVVVVVVVVEEALSTVRFSSLNSRQLEHAYEQLS